MGEECRAASGRTARNGWSYAGASSGRAEADGCHARTAAWRATRPSQTLERQLQQCVVKTGSGGWRLEDGWPERGVRTITTTAACRAKRSWAGGVALR